MMKEIEFSRPAGEVSCIIGNLFETLDPPCDLGRSTDLVICGVTHAQNYGRLTIKTDCCIFYGRPEDLAAVMTGRCPKGGCGNG